MTDFNRLRLAAKGNPERLNEILQLEGRERFSHKLPEFCANQETRFPDLLAGEQATSEALARVHADIAGPTQRVLDLTFGLGIDAFEFARRGTSVTALDLNPERAKAGADNARALGLTEVNVVCADCFDWLADYQGEPFDIIMADPARRGEGGRRLFSLADCSPDLSGHIDSLLSKGKRLLVKASPMLDPTLTASQLGHNADIFAIGTRREAKELTALLPGNSVRAAIMADIDKTFVFSPSALPRQFRNPESGLTLYEPWAPVMKLGLYNSLALSTNTLPIAPNTHLFIGRNGIEFPGEAFEIEKVMPLSKQSIRLLKEIEASVSIRNFPIPAQELAKRLKAKESQTKRIFGVTNSQGEKLLILATR